MKKGILRFHLVNLQPPSCYNGKGQSDGVHIFYKRKGLIIVYHMDLLKTFRNQYYLVPSHLSIPSWYCRPIYIRQASYLKEVELDPKSSSRGESCTPPA